VMVRVRASGGAGATLSRRRLPLGAGRQLHQHQYDSRASLAAATLPTRFVLHLRHIAEHSTLSYMVDMNIKTICFQSSLPAVLDYSNATSLQH